MKEEWKYQFRDKMNSYSEQAPDGLLDEIMSVIDTDLPDMKKQDRHPARRKITLISAAGLAAAAMLALAILPRKAGNGSLQPQQELARTVIAEAGSQDLDGKPGSGTVDNDEDAGNMYHAQKEARTATEKESIYTAEYLNHDEYPSSDGTADIVFASPEKQEEAREAEDTPAPQTKEEEIGIIRNNPSGWQQLLLAESSQKKKDRKSSFNIYASGFSVSSTSHSGYSRTVMQAAETPVKYGESQLAGIMMMNWTRDISTETRHFLPIRAGVSFSWGFAPRWSLETGLTYSWLISRSRTGSDSYYMDSRQTLHYLGIPLNIGYSIWDNNWLRLYASAGGMVEKSVYGSIGKDYVYGNETRSRETDKVIVKPLQWSVAANAGIQFKLSRLVGIYLEPGIIYHFRNGSPVETVYSEQPLNFNLNLGLRFSFEQQGRH